MTLESPGFSRGEYVKDSEHRTRSLTDEANQVARLLDEMDEDFRERALRATLMFKELDEERKALHTETFVFARIIYRNPRNNPQAI